MWDAGRGDDVCSKRALIPKAGEVGVRWDSRCALALPRSSFVGSWEGSDALVSVRKTSVRVCVCVCVCAVVELKGRPYLFRSLDYLGAVGIENLWGRLMHSTRFVGHVLLSLHRDHGKNQ